MEVWNPLEFPGGGNAVVNERSSPRCYEHSLRSVITVPFLGEFNSNVENTERHDRIFPTKFRQPKDEFKGMLLSCVDLVYCDEEDKTKPHRNFGGQFTDEETNTLRFISDISMGYYAKLNTNSTPMKKNTKYAVLYAFRPWRSDSGEPELTVKEMKTAR